LAGTLFEWGRRQFIIPGTRDRASPADTFILQVSSAPVLELASLGHGRCVPPSDAPAQFGLGR
jgi:hypothetical protein